MKTLKGVKARVKLGAKLKIVQAHKGHPYLNVVRKVVFVNTVSFGLQDPANHEQVSYLHWPLSSNLTFPAPNQFRVLESHFDVTYEIVE